MIRAAWGSPVEIFSKFNDLGHTRLGRVTPKVSLQVGNRKARYLLVSLHAVLISESDHLMDKFIREPPRRVDKGKGVIPHPSPEALGVSLPSPSLIAHAAGAGRRERRKSKVKEKTHHDRRLRKTWADGGRNKKK